MLIEVLLLFSARIAAGARSIYASLEGRSREMNKSDKKRGAARSF